MEKFNFIGKDITKEKKDKAKNRLNRLSFSNAFPDDKELVKTKLEKELIETAVSLVDEEVTSLGLNPNSLEEIQVHEYDVDTYKDLVGSDSPTGLSGHYTAYTQKIQLPIKRVGELGFLKKTMLQIMKKYEEPGLKNKINFLHTIMHEDVHQEQYHSFDLDENEDILLRRVGYDNSNNNPEYNHQHFDGFNEAVNQKTVISRIELNKKLLEDKYGITEKDIKEYNSLDGYFLQGIVLDKIIESLAETKKISQDEAWKVIEKGQFTGEMMYMRDIEKYYGPGSLRILGSMGYKYNKENLEEFENYFLYFDKSISDLHRSVLGKKIMDKLNSKEKKDYETHINLMKKKDI